MRSQLRLSLRLEQRKRVELLQVAGWFSLGEVFLPFALGLPVMVGDVEGDVTAWRSGVAN